MKGEDEIKLSNSTLRNRSIATLMVVMLSPRKWRLSERGRVKNHRSHRLNGQQWSNQSAELADFSNPGNLNLLDQGLVSKYSGIVDVN